MIPRYLPGALIVVLGLAFASPAEAQIGTMIEPVGYSGSIWFQIAWAGAALLVLAVIVIHELSAILALCPFAAKATGATTKFEMTSGALGGNFERIAMRGEGALRHFQG